MPQNIEIKARIPSVKAIEPLAAAIATEAPLDLEQDDTFFFRVQTDGSSCGNLPTARPS